jgi:magnesium transporter
MLTVRMLQSEKLVSGGLELLHQVGAKWIDVIGPTEDVMNTLREKFGLHRLAIEDCLHVDQRPKIEEYASQLANQKNEKHQFIVLQGFSLRKEKHDEELVMHEIHMFLGSDFLITVHEEMHPLFEAALTRVVEEPIETFGRGLDFLAYLCADGLLDGTFPVLEHYNEDIEELEELLFTGKPSQQVIQQAFRLKRSLVQLRRVMSPQRDVISLLSRSGVAQVSEKTTLYFRDVYDHLFRLTEHIDSTRDLLGNVMDAYLSVVANRTGEISKQLTIFASIFMPMSFVVGFFGQNFDFIGKEPQPMIMFGSLLIVPIAMFFWFRHKEWF